MSLSHAFGTQVHHAQKVNDYKPFLAALYPELIGNASWWAWSDADLLFGDLMKYIDLAEPATASVVCPLYPNPWQAASWGPLTAFRLLSESSHVEGRSRRPGGHELFRHLSRWKRVLETAQPSQFVRRPRALILRQHVPMTLIYH